MMDGEWLTPADGPQAIPELTVEDVRQGTRWRVELSNYSRMEATGEGRVWVNTTEAQDAALYLAGLREGMLVRLILEVVPCQDCGQPADTVVS